METVYLKAKIGATMAKAIRQKCLDCSENSAEVRQCPAVKCPLWGYRFGCKPATAIARLGNTNIVKLLEV